MVSNHLKPHNIVNDFKLVGVCLPIPESGLFDAVYLAQKYPGS
jgi:hypothetical protein